MNLCDIIMFSYFVDWKFGDKPASTVVVSWVVQINSQVQTLKL